MATFEVKTSSTVELVDIIDKTERIYILSCGVPGIEMEQLRRASLLTKEYFEKFCKRG
ncbi:MAG: hypothetical protein V3U51_03080 [Thermoplasmata archaeon]